jgi:FkbM family methyltransferase
MNLIISEISPTICLNMIVKDESHIIQKTLEMLCSKINFSYWVICDTGSSDNTPEIITNFFKTKNIPGELHTHAWKNFSHNRNLGLNLAFNKTDLLFVFDADDEIHGHISIPKNIDCDGYLLNFGSEKGVSYQRILLVNNRIQWYYLAVVHEFINCIKPRPIIQPIEGDYYIVSGRNGNRSLDPNKYLNDAKLIEDAYYEAKNSNDLLYLRYAFYCANSYKDANINEDAIKWYKITLSQDNWNQEKYMSCLNLYYAYDRIGEKEKAIYYLVESLKYDSERLECICILIQYYLIADLSLLAWQYYGIVKNFYENHYLNANFNNKLFVDNDKANFYLPYYMILIADKVKEVIPEALSTIIKMFEIVFIKQCPINDDFCIGNLLYNLQFFIDVCVSSNDNFITLFQSYIEFLEDNNYNLYKHKDTFLYKYEIYGITFKSFQQINNIQLFSTTECKNSNNILFYTGFSNLPWNHSFANNNALGGSETALINLANQLSKHYNIYISGQVAEETINNITYVNLDNLKELIKTTAFHTIIVSRYVAFYEMFPEISFYQSFIWGHDICLFNYGCNLDVSLILNKWSPKINGCICQTEWHKNLFAEKYPELTNKLFIINNGIETDKFIFKPIKNSNRFIYTSCAERGLDRLLELWEQIIIELPDAELFIASYNPFPKDNNYFEKQLHAIIQKYDNIKHVGSLTKNELYKLMSTAEFWLYPTNFSETSCITAMEMLMSEVICIYYPVAGLLNTLGDYGIPVNKGNEINTIIELTTKQKQDIKRKGKEYALACSWENRSYEWVNLISKKSDYTIAIFNGCPFHFEMFGYILNYAKNNNIWVDIYTTTDNNLGWIDFYRSKFSNFKITNIDLFFNIDKKQYKYIFLITDDDYCFINKNISYENIIIINHYWKIRNPHGQRYLNCAPFKESNLDFCYPIYPIFTSNEKNNNNIITIIGGGEVTHGSLNYNIDIINRFCIQNQDNIILNFICRSLNETFLIGLSNKFKVNIYSDLNTNEMIDILKQTNYVYVTFSNCNDKNSLHSCSGSLHLSFSTLCKCIILDTTNELLQIKNCVTYNDIENTPIILGNVDFDKLEKERQEYVNQFEKYFNTYKYYFKYDDVKVKLLKNKKEIYDNFYVRANCEPMLRKLVSYLWDNFVDKNIIDLGCWIGDNTIPWALKSKGIIYAIDPSVENLNNINELAKINNLNNIITINHTISDTFGEVFTNENDLTHISCNEITGIHKLHTVTLDYLKLENIGLLHLDVEGFEQKVLNGAKSLLENYNPVIIWENHINKDDYWYTINFLNNYGYKTYMINELLPNCFPDCRNFISVINHNIDIDKINNNFKQIYQDFLAHKNQNFLIKMENNLLIPIPKKIIQTWEHKNFEPEFQEIIDYWKKNNPDYEYLLFDKNERSLFIKNNFNEDVYETYNLLVPGANKADLFRYCYLYINGGVYVDIDTLCIGKLDNILLSEINLVVLIDFNSNPFEGQHNLACGFIASIPKHPALLNSINFIVDNVKNNIIFQSRLDFTGPGILGRAVNSYIGLEETSSFIGKEGIYNNIYFLKFQKVTEYVTDINDNILFQNKNGNAKIIELYNNECNKIKNFVSWVTCPIENLINKK